MKGRSKSMGLAAALALLFEVLATAVGARVKR